MNYARIKSVDEREIQSCLNNGWVVIEVEKADTSFDAPGTSNKIEYHIGYPYKKLSEDLLSIISKYEEFGLKEVLFQKFADENNEIISEYVKNGDKDYDTDVALFMANYELITKNKQTKFGKEYTQQELEDQGRYNF